MLCYLLFFLNQALAFVPTPTYFLVHMFLVLMQFNPCHVRAGTLMLLWTWERVCTDWCQWSCWGVHAVYALPAFGWDISMFKQVFKALCFTMAGNLQFHGDSCLQKTVLAKTVLWMIHFPLSSFFFSYTFTQLQKKLPDGKNHIKIGIC